MKYAEKKERDFRASLEKEAYLQSQLSPEELQRQKAALNPAPTFKDFVEFPDEATGSKGGLFWSEYGTNRYSSQPKTLTFYMNRIDVLLKFEPLANAKLDAIDDQVLSAYTNHRHGERVKASTLNRDMATLHLILKQAQIQKFIAMIPAFPKRGKEKSAGKVLSLHDEKIYMAAVDEDLHDFAMILLYTGLEPGTIAVLDWSDVHATSSKRFENGYIHGRCQKSDARERDRGMSAKLATVVRERWMRMGRPKSGWVFPADRVGQSAPTPLTTFESAHKRLWKKTKTWTPLTISRFRLYDLRHTFLTRFWKSGADAIRLQRAAGWKSTRMAAVYIHPDETSDALADARFIAYMESQEASLTEKAN